MDQDHRDRALALFLKTSSLDADTSPRRAAEIGWDDGAEFGFQEREGQAVRLLTKVTVELGVLRNVVAEWRKSVDVHVRVGYAFEADKDLAEALDFLPMDADADRLLSFLRSAAEVCWRLRDPTLDPKVIDQRAQEMHRALDRAMESQAVHRLLEPMSWEREDAPSR